MIEADSSHNSPDARRTAMPQEIEDKIMSVLPRAIADWIRYEATCNYDIKAVFQLWLDGVKGRPGGMTEVELLKSLQGIRRNETSRAYGVTHPQSRLPMAA